MLIRILFSIAVAAGVAGPASALAPAPASEEDRRTVEAALRQSPAGATIATLERHFPAETGVLLRRLTDILVTHLDDRDLAMAQAGRELQLFLVGRFGLAVNAPAADLVRIARMRLALYERVQRDDPALCGRLARGEVDPRALGAAYLDEGTALFETLIAAAGAASRGPEIAGRGRLGAADNQAWARAMLASGQAAPGSSADPCRQLVVMYRSMAALPGESAANVMAYVLAREQSAWEGRSGQGRQP